MDRRETTSGRIRGIRRTSDGMARVLRQRMTPAEERLWHSLRGRHVASLKFRRQHPLGPYIVDFCCPEIRLVIEIDGEVHETQKEYDAGRFEALQHFGYRVIRFSNDDVLLRHESVLDTILSLVSNPTKRQPNP